LTSTIKYLIKASKRLKVSLIRIFFLHYYYLIIRRKNIFSHPRVQIEGINNIIIKGALRIGLNYVGFIHKRDYTLLNIRGQLYIEGDVSLGQGIRLDISPGAIVKIGNDSTITALTKLIIVHGLDIGANCVISWDCLILDDDFHQIRYSNTKNATNKPKKIVIGNSVWIGSNVNIYKGVIIPDGCVVASNSVLKDQFFERNALIAGNPAEIIKREISWR
jgi:acetyltransferase-like isoleucine patch superfamily enzyme